MFSRGIDRSYFLSNLSQGLPDKDFGVCHPIGGSIIDGGNTMNEERL
jgi:hypothetical protein